MEDKRDTSRDFQEEGYIMSAAVKRIIKHDRGTSAKVSAFQRRRIAELKEMVDRKNRGEAVDTSEVRRRWQRVGIIDTEGNLAFPYRKEE